MATAVNAKADEQKRRRGRPATRTSEETRDAILVAARKCFADVGFTAATNSEIAKTAGVTASALYNHFESKSELYVAVCVQVDQEITSFHSNAVEGFSSSREALVNVIDKSIELYEKDPTLATFGSKVSMEVVSNQEIALPLGEKIKGGVEEILVEVIKKGQARGEINKSINATELANMYISASMGMAQTALLLGKEYYTASMKTLKSLFSNEVFTESN